MSSAFSTRDCAATLYLRCTAPPAPAFRAGTRGTRASSLSSVKHLPSSKQGDLSSLPSASTIMPVHVWSQNAICLFVRRVFFADSSEETLVRTKYDVLDKTIADPGERVRCRGERSHVTLTGFAKPDSNIRADYSPRERVAVGMTVASRNPTGTYLISYRYLCLTAGSGGAGSRAGGGVSAGAGKDGRRGVSYTIWWGFLYDTYPIVS